MKFQNRSIHGFKVMLCIKKHDERTDGRTDGRTTQKQYAPPTSLKLGHNKDRQTARETNIKHSHMHFMAIMGCVATQTDAKNILKEIT